MTGFAGKGAGELNLIILIPKTEARAQGGEVSWLFNLYSLKNLGYQLSWYLRYTSLYFMKDHKTGIFTWTQYWVLPWESSKLWYDDHEWKSQMFSVMAQHIFHDDEEDRTAWGVFYVLTCKWTLYLSFLQRRSIQCFSDFMEFMLRWCKSSFHWQPSA